MLRLKLRPVGTSTGVVFPKEFLARLHASSGQTLYAIETAQGYLLTMIDPTVEEQVETGEAFMDRYKETFATLAK